MPLMHLFNFPFPGLPVVALVVQFPLGVLAFAVEWSQRKKRPTARRQPQASRRMDAERSALSPLERQSEPGARKPEPPSVPPPLPSEPSELAPEPAATDKAPEPQVVPVPSAALQAELSPPAIEIREPEHRESAPEVEAESTPAVESEASPPTQTSIVEAHQTQRKQPVPIGLGLRKTREGFLARIRAAITGGKRVDEIYDGLEEALIGGDVGVETSMKLVEALRSTLKNDARADTIRETLKQEITQTLVSVERPLNDSSPLVIMMAGVNGVGKTTSVAKLAALLKAERGSVIVAAADTFRAAAIDQLQIWCDRVGVEMIKQKQGSDPAAVAFDAVKAAKAREAQVLIIDTAGRLQTKVNLMEELKKIARVVGREIPGAPHETWLVLDATTGQNALSQAKTFGEAVKLTGVIVAKLDSSAKGGVIISIAERLKLPVRYVGLGEEVEDLREFDAREFVDALFSESDDSRIASGTYAA
jgi:fused signal recognition particle receptor